MTIFIGADHRGVELKNQILEYLHEKNIRTEDLGPYELVALDDAADYSKKVDEVSDDWRAGRCEFPQQAFYGFYTNNTVYFSNFISTQSN